VLTDHFYPASQKKCPGSAPAKKQAPLCPAGQPEIARGGTVYVIGIAAASAQKNGNPPRQIHPLVSIMKSDALIMTAAAVLASILISLATHVSAIFGSSEAPRLLHTSRQTLRLWNRPSIVIHRAEVVLNPRPLFG
jgi:hypothetical protein